MSPEKAIFVEGLSGLKQADLTGYSRLYFGHETCERRIPSLQELKEAKKIAEKNSLAFSLVTPFCTNAGLEKLRQLFQYLSKEDEIIVNDWGVLFAVSGQSKAVPVFGRLLNKQYRDPRIALFTKAPAELRAHLASSQSSSRLFRHLIDRFGVQRVELDNLLQGIGTKFDGGGLSASLYYPFVFVAATRFCLTANCDRLSFAKKVGVLACGKECLSYTSFKLENKEFDKPFYLFGNALYFENSSIPKNLEKKGIDRLVFTAKGLQQ